MPQATAEGEKRGDHWLHDESAHSFFSPTISCSFRSITYGAELSKHKHQLPTEVGQVTPGVGLGGEGKIVLLLTYTKSAPFLIPGL